MLYMLVPDFFAPANVMKLLEIVRGENSSPENLTACVKLGKKLGKMPVIAGNCFGMNGHYELLCSSY